MRYLIGDEAFFRTLRRQAYPAKEMEKITTGKQNRFATTDDFKQIAEEESKMELDWFFEMYLRQPKLPKLTTVTNGDKIEINWETPGNLPFPMPVEIETNGKTQKIEMKNGKAEISWDGKIMPVFDKNGWILKGQ